MKAGGGTAPMWVIVLVLALVSVEPITHYWIAGSETVDAAPTGLHTADSSIYLNAMKMLGNGFFRPTPLARRRTGPTISDSYPRRSTGSMPSWELWAALFKSTHFYFSVSQMR